VPHGQAFLGCTIVDRALDFGDLVDAS